MDILNPRATTKKIKNKKNTKNTKSLKELKCYIRKYLPNVKEGNKRGREEQEKHELQIKRKMTDVIQPCQ